MNTKGQSLIELTMLLPLMIAMWAALLWFGQAFIISIELMHTARHGVFWLAYNHSGMAPAVEMERVEQECRSFLQREAPGIHLDQITIQIQPGDTWEPVGPQNLLDLPGVIRLVAKLRTTIKNAAGLIHFQPASVKIEYALKSPSLLRAIPGFPQSIPLRGYCVCYR
jgi:hypothetical protein